MGGDKEGKRSKKKGFFAVLLAALGAFAFMKKRRAATEEAGWEEAKPTES